MMNWAKKALADVAGTQEPIYGSSAIRSVSDQAKTTSYTEISKDDLKWAAMDSTCVETQTFYLMADDGHIGMVQVIYSNVAGIRTTCQFNTKVFYPDKATPILWSSDPLDKHSFDENMCCFRAQGCSADLSQDGESYTIKSSTNRKSIVDLKVTKDAPGFVVGNDGTSYFGTDPQKPWGRMRHAFWPRCRVEGSILTQGGELDFKGRGFFVHALQGMKPHHAAARWNFVNFQSPTYSAVMMEYTTPPSYGSTVVSVGGIATQGKIICAGSSNNAKHDEIKGDPENSWPEPGSVAFTWSGKTRDGQAVEADVHGSLGERLDRVDVMAEVPKFVKQIVAGAAGTKPYIYQYGPKLTLRIKIGDEVKKEEGILFTEATFIS
ncbi:putative cell survival pathways protein [Elasticomyces elasticus]|nr:putative cell survival pathways protein [Elasticomyces elasticus]